MLLWPLSENPLEITKGRFNLKSVSGSPLKFLNQSAFFDSSATQGLGKQGIYAKDIVGYRGGYNNVSYDGFVISFEMENYPGMAINTNYPLFTLIDNITGGGPYGIRLSYSYPNGLVFDYLPTYTSAISYAMDVIPATGGGHTVVIGVGDGDAGGTSTPASYYPNRRHKIQLEVRTYDTSSTYVRLYVDGILKGSTTIGAAFSLNTSSNFNFYIGYDGTTSSGYIGKIANFKVYKTKVDLSAPLTFTDTKGKAKIRYYNRSNPSIITGSVLSTQNYLRPLYAYGTTLTFVNTSKPAIINGGLSSTNFGLPKTLYTIGAGLATKSAPLFIKSSAVNYPFSLFLAGSANLVTDTTPLTITGSTVPLKYKYTDLFIGGMYKPFSFPLTVVNNDNNYSYNYYTLFVKGSNKQYVTSKPLFIKNNATIVQSFKPLFIGGNGVFNSAAVFHKVNTLYVGGDNGASKAVTLFIGSPYNYTGLGKTLIITGLPLITKSVNLSIPKVKLQPKLVPLFVGGF